MLHCLRFWFWKCLEALAALLRASGAVGRFVSRVVRRSCCAAFYALLARCVHFPGICILSLPSYCVGDPLALCLRRMLHRLRSASSVLRCVGDPVALWPPANASLVPICVRRLSLFLARSALSVVLCCFYALLARCHRAALPPVLVLEVFGGSRCPSTRVRSVGRFVGRVVRRSCRAAFCALLVRCVL